MTRSNDAQGVIRVLMVMPSFYPVVGGMELQVERLIPYLREHGIDAVVLTRRTVGTTARSQRNSIEIRRVSITGGPGMRSIAFTAFGTADMLRNHRDIDILHAHSVMSATTAIAIAGVLLRKPRVVTVHVTYEPDHLLNKPFGRQRLRLYRRIVSRFVSISSDIERLLVQHDVPSSRIVSISNGVDTTNFCPTCEPERAALRTELGLPGDRPIVVFAGRLQPVKQVDVLLRSWSGVSGGHLVILGDGEERERLEELARSMQIERRVEFRGMVTDVVDFLRAADIFVLPSSSEGLSVALLEAMSSGLVPVASAVSGAVDLIEDRVNGLLVESGNVEQLRAALEHAVQSDDWRKDAGERARATVVADYDLRIIASRLNDMYRELLTERGDRSR